MTAPGMACGAAREALAAGASGPALSEHLQGCEACQGTAERYGTLRRFYSLDAAGEQAADFDERVMARVVQTVPLARRRVPAPLVAAVLTAAVALSLWLALGRKPATVPAPVAADAAEAEVVEAEAGPETGGSVPPSPTGIPISDDEKAQVAARPDEELLRSFEMLAGLDVFFPGDFTYGPRPEATPAPRTLSDDEVWMRLGAWRSLAPSERARLDELARRFRSLPIERQEALEERLTTVETLFPEDRAGLGRLSARLAELDARQRQRLALEVKSLFFETAPRRAARWRALPFARGLTGQELAAGETLLKR